MKNPADNIRSWMTILERDLPAFDAGRWKQDVQAVANTEIATFSDEFRNADFSKKETVIRYVIAVKRLVEKLEGILTHYESMTKNDGATTAVGSEQLRNALAQFKTGLMKSVKEIDALDEAAYKAGYDVVAKKLQASKSVIADTIAAIKPAIKQRSMGNFTNPVVRILQLVNQLPDAIDNLVDKIEGVSKMTDFRKINAKA